ncbi:MAG: tRNA lysidine(34) synthetase TilS [Burkholderiales bacterium]
MASSKKPLADELPAHVSAILKRWIEPGQRVCLALSGGLDSVVLFDLLLSLRETVPFKLSALHVNHQLSPNAAQWNLFCADLCAQAGVAFKSIAVTVEQNKGLGLEAAARKARYAAFAAQPCDFLVLAQHLDDQAETVLLQLLRGTGLKGASAMPEARELESGRPGLMLLRPLLDIPRRVLANYAAGRSLRWVEDESNAASDFDRNFLRHEILPRIEQRFPAYRQSLLRASRHFAEAACLLDDLARIDVGAALKANVLRLAALQGLSSARVHNALRFYLTHCGVPMPSVKRLREIGSQLLSARPDSAVCINLGEFEIRRFRGDAYVLHRLSKDTSAWVAEWRGEGQVALPHGRLYFKTVTGCGLSVQKLQGCSLAINLRQGGEGLRTDERGSRRTLKNLLQEAALPPWVRCRLPLLFAENNLVCVPGVAVAWDWRAKDGEKGVAVEWHPLASDLKYG